MPTQRTRIQIYNMLQTSILNKKFYLIYNKKGDRKKLRSIRVSDCRAYISLIRN